MDDFFKRFYAVPKQKTKILKHKARSYKLSRVVIELRRFVGDKTEIELDPEERVVFPATGFYGSYVFHLDHVIYNGDSAIRAVYTQAFSSCMRFD